MADYENLQDFKRVRVKNQLYNIEESIIKLRESDKRKQGINPIYKQISEACRKINLIINDNCDLLGDDGKCLRLPRICNLDYENCLNKDKFINDNFQKIVIDDASLTIKRLEEKKEYYIPIELIKLKFNIKGELTWIDIERKFFGEDKTKYLYLKTKGD